MFFCFGCEGKGLICDGTNKCHQEYYLCGKFHGFMKNCMKFGSCYYIITHKFIYNSVTVHQICSFASNFILEFPLTNLAGNLQ